ncbi:MAG: hypothetical protein CM1200mP18_19580 [Gammaproteobacteria bacterium]|nr:MAG: hypothetical protein CM1200mP18_19580 [Gammaproteobacteria bacterium]
MPPVLIVIMILLGYMVLGMFMDAIGMLLLNPFRSSIPRLLVLARSDLVRDNRG